MKPDSLFGKWGTSSRKQNNIGSRSIWQRRRAPPHSIPSEPSFTALDSCCFPKTAAWDERRLDEPGSRKVHFSSDFEVQYNHRAAICCPAPRRLVAGLSLPRRPGLRERRSDDHRQWRHDFVPPAPTCSLSKSAGRPFPHAVSFSASQVIQSSRLTHRFPSGKADSPAPGWETVQGEVGLDHRDR